MHQRYLSFSQYQQQLRGTLYKPQFEHDACGIGFVAYLDGCPHPDVLPMALKALANLAHRGGVAADGKTSDGAGILCQFPYNFFVQDLEKYSITAPPQGNLAVGQLFLPTDITKRNQAKQIIETVVNRQALGLKLVIWRDVPINRRVLGPQAEATQPAIQQVLLAPQETVDQITFERRLYLARRTIEQEMRAADINDVYIASFSSRVIVYKGLLIGEDLGLFYGDLQHHEFQVGMATFHQRYSTNTFPAWHRAQPFRMLCHNGEINTIQGNVNWMRARENDLAHPVWGDQIELLKPVIDDQGSDSAMLDNVLELLTLSGRDLPQAIAMLAPEAWAMHPHTPQFQAQSDFYKYHACLMEPWDGPAALVFSDGQTVGITLDRNGLRPIRYLQTTGGLVIAGSEAGFVPVDEALVVKKGKLGPGEMLVVDTLTERIYDNAQIKNRLAAEKPYGDWVKEMIVPLPSRLIPPPDRGNNLTKEALLVEQSRFGYTAEELTVILRPMAQSGKVPVGSMGDDTPIAYLSEMHRPVHHYLKQRFAQVTNPPIDPLREESGMSLQILLGQRVNILQEGSDRPAQILLDSPILYGDELHTIETLDRPGFCTVRLSAAFDAANGPAGMRPAIKALTAEAEAAVRQASPAGNKAAILILSDKITTDAQAPIPILLAVGAIHHRLIDAGLRSRVSLVVETGEARDVHHLATLVGYGAEAINPYLALATVAQLAIDGKIKGVDSPLAAMDNYVHALNKGLLKIMSKMGISTIDSYCGAQIFEALGLSSDVIELSLPGTPANLGGATFLSLAESVCHRHTVTFENGPRLESPGLFKFKKTGEYHGFNPTVVRTLQKAVVNKDYGAYKTFADLCNHQRYATPKQGLRIEADREPIPLSQVEPLSEIIRRFSTAAISHGSISAEAHEDLAIAMNRLGGMSNSGEGGESVARFGTERNSAIKQVASGRFGVTPHYLMHAREIQIKVAQGAKPGEGGQLPGHKVSVEIATLRYSNPGVGLISPPPHHDIYSIEDLAQLIFDLKQINPMAAVSVKLVAETGVGTVAAGVVKGGADVVHISGGDGGTGASPLNSMKHAGLPYELGLAEAQQTLIANDLRDRVRLRIDGGLKTGHDVVMAALLGADEYSFGTSALIAEGCLMARACHSNTCPVGIATQKLNLRAKYPGNPEKVMAYITFVVQEVRELLASLGYHSLDDIIGRVDLLHPAADNPLDLTALLATPDPRGLLPRHNLSPNDISRVTPMNWGLLELARPALRQTNAVQRTLSISNTDRSVGATLSGAIAAKFGANGLPDDRIHFTFQGSAGQSFGAFNSKGLHLTVVGEVNDYVGKGMSGGEIIIKLPSESRLRSQENIILGNTALYGATAGRLFAAGLAGERFAVRNSGAVAVVEGVGNHGCEYMTGGVVVVLGSVGYNFGAGMSGGTAYVYDPGHQLPVKLNPDMVKIVSLEAGDEAALLPLLHDHAAKTSSAQTREIVENWSMTRYFFKKVTPIAEPMLAVNKPAEASVQK